MLEIYIPNREALDLFKAGLAEAGLVVRSRRFLGFRLRPETGVIELTKKNTSAIVKAIAAACARNPEGIYSFREMFSNNTAEWEVGPAAVEKKQEKKPAKK